MTEETSTQESLDSGDLAEFLIKPDDIEIQSVSSLYASGQMNLDKIQVTEIQKDVNVQGYRAQISGNIYISTTSYENHTLRGGSIVPGGSTVTTELVKTNNTFTTLFQDVFHSYPISLIALGEHLLKFKDPPPIFREGIVFWSKVPYYVTLEDLRRGLVRKSRVLALAPRRLSAEHFKNGTTASSAYNTAIKKILAGASSNGAVSSKSNGEVSFDIEAGENSEPSDTRSSETGEEARIRERLDADSAFARQALELLRLEAEETDEEWSWENSDGVQP